MNYETKYEKVVKARERESETQTGKWMSNVKSMSCYIC